MKVKYLFIFIMFILFTMVPNVYCETLNVPSEYISIQDAIDLSVDGDVINVDPGLYHERLIFSGKNITVVGTGGAENTVIDADRWGTGVTFENGDTSVLRGFTITNGDTTFSYTKSGGIVVYRSNPLIENCVIKGNHGHQGGGVWATEGTFKSCKIVENISQFEGGGVFTWWPGINGYPTFVSCLIARNQCNKGAGVFGWSNLINCSIIDNTGAPGNGIMNADNSTITNCIVYGNSTLQIASFRADVTYSNVQGEPLYSGVGNFNDDPSFKGGDDCYYHLTDTSPCIDSGTFIGEVDLDIDLEPRPVGHGLDVGADEYGGMPVSVNLPSHDLIDTNDLTICPNEIVYSKVINGKIKGFKLIEHKDNNGRMVLKIGYDGDVSIKNGEIENVQIIILIPSGDEIVKIEGTTNLFGKDNKNLEQLQLKRTKQ